MQTMENHLDQQPGSRDVLYIIFKHKKKIIFFFFAVIAIIGLTTLLSPAIYQSEAKLFIKLGRETVTRDSDSSPNQRISVSQSLESQINSELEILKSQELALQLVEEMGLASFLNTPADSIFQNSPVIVKFRQTLKKIKDLPKKALAGLFISANPEEPISARGEIEMVAAQISQNLQAEVIKDSNVIRLAYESESPKLSHDVLEQLISLYLDMHMKLLGSPESFDFFKKEADRFRLQLEATEKKIQEFKNGIGSGSELSTITELNNGLHDLKLKEQELLATFTETSIPVTEIRRQIQKTEKNLDEQLKKNNTAAVHLAKLERERELLEKNYRKYASTLEQARIDQALEAEKISNIKIAQTPNIPLEPIRPRTGMILTLGLFMALFGALGMAFFIEYFDSSLQKPEEIEKILQIPVLGSVQEMKK